VKAGKQTWSIDGRSAGESEPSGKLLAAIADASRALAPRGQPPGRLGFGEGARKAVPQDLGEMVAGTATPAL
jgi:hypothetical protein